MSLDYEIVLPDNNDTEHDQLANTHVAFVPNSNATPDPNTMKKMEMTLEQMRMFRRALEQAQAQPSAQTRTQARAKNRARNKMSRMSRKQNR